MWFGNAGSVMQARELRYRPVGKVGGVQVGFGAGGLPVGLRINLEPMIYSLERKHFPVALCFF